MSRPVLVPIPTIDSVELAPLAPGRNLAPRAFTSREIFDAEQRAVFARAWVHVADVRDVATMALVRIRIGQVGPMICGCLDDTAPELADWAGELPAALARAGADRWEPAWELTYELDASWKVFVENANDGYHVPFVHDVL